MSLEQKRYYDAGYRDGMLAMLSVVKRQTLLAWSTDPQMAAEVLRSVEQILAGGGPNDGRGN